MSTSLSLSPSSSMDEPEPLCDLDGEMEKFAQTMPDTNDDDRNRLFDDKAGMSSGEDGSTGDSPITSVPSENTATESASDNVVSSTSNELSDGTDLSDSDEKELHDAAFAAARSASGRKAGPANNREKVVSSHVAASADHIAQATAPTHVDTVILIKKDFEPTNRARMGVSKSLQYLNLLISEGNAELRRTKTTVSVVELDKVYSLHQFMAAVWEIWEEEGRGKGCKKLVTYVPFTLLRFICLGCRISYRKRESKNYKALKSVYAKFETFCKGTDKSAAGLASAVATDDWTSFFNDLCGLSGMAVNGGPKALRITSWKWECITHIPPETALEALNGCINILEQVAQGPISAPQSPPPSPQSEGFGDNEESSDEEQSRLYGSGRRRDDGDGYAEEEEDVNGDAFKRPKVTGFGTSNASEDSSQSNYLKLSSTEVGHNIYHDRY